MWRRSWCALLTDRLKVKCVSINCLYARMAAKKISINKLWFIFQFNTESHYILENNRESLVWSMRDKQKIAPSEAVILSRLSIWIRLAVTKVWRRVHQQIIGYLQFNRASHYIFLMLTVHRKNPLNLWFSVFLWILYIPGPCISFESLLKKIKTNSIIICFILVCIHRN